MIEPKRIETATIVRTVLLALALINQSLVFAGYSPLPFADADVEAFITVAFTIVASVLAWWSNNSVTRKARKADELARRNGLK